jgi:hypothetical protein
MQRIELKLKQASAVLGVTPKDLQNLVQLKVLKPLRRNGVHWFDTERLLEAKVAFYLKDALGVSSQILGRFTDALAGELKNGNGSKARYVALLSRLRAGGEAIEIRIPLRALAKELESQLPRATARQDLPKGRKHPGWKRAMLRSMTAAARDMGEVSEAQILEVIRQCRKERKQLPEISIARPTRKTA